MAASKDPAAYPAAFPILLEHFSVSDAEPVTQHFLRAADAEKLRFTFYNYKRALRNSGDARSLRIASGVIIKLLDRTSGGASLEFSLRDNADYALGLEAAILRAQQESSGHPPSPQERASTLTTPQPSPELSSDEVVNRYLAGKTTDNT